MANHLLFNRDGWGQARPEVDSRRENQPAESDSSDESSTARPTVQEPAASIPQKSADEAALHIPEDPEDADQSEAAGPSETPEVAEEPMNDPTDGKEPAASPEPPGTPEAADSGDEGGHTSSRDEDVPALPDAAGPPSAATDDVPAVPEPTDARIKRWDPAKLNLPRPPASDSSTPGPEADTEQVDQRTVDEANAVAYIAAMKDERPWLAPAADCEPAVQSIYTSLDQGIGHAHIRHGPMGDDQMYAARVARLEDPAQLDPHQRARGIDGINSANLHNCAEFATRVHDAGAFATLVAALCEEPRVQQALHTGWNDIPPAPVSVMIADVLGPNGHEYCSGFRLKGEWPQSRVERRQWVEAHAAGQDLSDLPEPQAERIPTFEGGRFVLMFKRNYSTNKYEINTIITEPVKD